MKIKSWPAARTESVLRLVWLLNTDILSVVKVDSDKCSRNEKLNLQVIFGLTAMTFACCRILPSLAENRRMLDPLSVAVTCFLSVLN